MGLDLYDEYWALVEAMNRAGLDHATVGAMALAIHGVPRATTDLDFLIEPADLDRARAAARECGFSVEALPMRFPDGMVVQRISKFEGEEFVTLDFLLVDDNSRPAWETRGEVQTERGPVRVVSRDGLIRMKVAAGRDRDLVDVARLREIDR